MPGMAGLGPSSLNASRVIVLRQARNGSFQVIEESGAIDPRQRAVGTR